MKKMNIIVMLHLTRTPYKWNVKSIKIPVFLNKPKNPEMYLELQEIIWAKFFANSITENHDFQLEIVLITTFFSTYQYIF